MSQRIGGRNQGKTSEVPVAEAFYLLSNTK